MRRNAARFGCRNSRRSGVTPSVRTMKRMVQSPVKWVMNSMGFAVRLPREARQPNQPNGARHNTNSNTFVHLLRSMSEVLFQIHPGVQLGDLISIPVEH